MSRNKCVETTAILLTHSYNCLLSRCTKAVSGQELLPQTRLASAVHHLSNISMRQWAIQSMCSHPTHYFRRWETSSKNNPGLLISRRTCRMKLGIALIFKDDMEANHIAFKVRSLYRVCPAWLLTGAAAHASFKGMSSWFLDSSQAMCNLLSVQWLTFKSCWSSMDKGICIGFGRRWFSFTMLDFVC